MARIRTVKPELFRHEGLLDLEEETGLPIRLAFIALFTAVDRSGRFKWRPRSLKAEAMPMDDVDLSRVLDALATRGFVERYTVDGVEYGCIPSWERHQSINNREAASELPAPPETQEKSDTSTRAPRVDDACPTPLVHAQAEGEGKGKGRSTPPKPPPAEGAKATRLPDDFDLPDEWRGWCREELEMTDEEIREQGLRFADYWRGVAGARGRKRDWLATWRNWCRRYCDEKPKRPVSATGGGGVFGQIGRNIAEAERRRGDGAEPGSPRKLLGGSRDGLDGGQSGSPSLRAVGAVR